MPELDADDLISSCVSKNNLDQIINILNDNNSKLKLKQEACRALSNLACDYSSPTLSQVDNNNNQNNNNGNFNDILSYKKGINAIITCLKENKKHVGILEQGIRALWYLSCDNEILQNYIRELGGIHEIMKVMNKYLQHNLQNMTGKKNGTTATGYHEEKELEEEKAGNSNNHTSSATNNSCVTKIVENCCGALWDLACDNKLNQMLICDLNGISIILHVIEKFPMEMTLLEQAIGALCNVGYYDDKNEIANANGIDIIISNLMMRNKISSGIQEQGLWTLSNIAKLHKENKLKIFSVENAIPFFIQMMSLHQNSDAVGEQCCRLLSVLSCNNEKCENLIIQENGAEVILKTMSIHYKENVLIEQGMRALRNLTNNSKNQHMIAQAGGIESIIDLMKTHTENEMIQEQGCSVLCSLSCDEKNQEKMSDFDGIHAILSAMKNHPFNSGVQEQACWVLCVLACDGENQTKISELHGTDIIITAMKNHFNNSEVQEQACWVLCNLSCDNVDLQMEIVEQDGIKQVIQSMNNFKDNAGVQEQGCSALHSLSYDNVHNQNKIIDEEGMECILQARKRFPKNKRVQEQAKMALDNMDQAFTDMDKRPEMTVRRNKINLKPLGEV